MRKIVAVVLNNLAYLCAEVGELTGGVLTTIAREIQPPKGSSKAKTESAKAKVRKDKEEPPWFGRVTWHDPPPKPPRRGKKPSEPEEPPQ